MKKTRIAWGRVTSYGTLFVLVAVMLVVGTFILGDRLQRTVEDNRPLQEVYPIYQDDDVLCYRISKGNDLKGVWHEEVQQCVKR
jgi:hypothetical protein